MAITDIAGRAAPFAQAAWEDQEIRDRLRKAAVQGQAAVVAARGRRKAPPSALKRAGQAIQETGRALAALGQTAQKQQRKQQRSRGKASLPLALAAAAGAAVLVSNRTSTTRGRTDG